MSDVNIMKQMRCISNPFFTSERLVGVNYERHLKRIFRFVQNLKKRTLSIGAVETAWQSLLRPGNGSSKNWQMRVNIQEIIIAGNLPEKVEHVCIYVCLGAIFHTD